MALNIGKRYLLITKKETILKKSIEVVSILNYQMAQKEPYDIISLAINERVIDKENDDMSYLYSKLYYKCIVQDGTNEVLLVWDDVIDETRTTELSISFQYITTLKIDDNSKIEVNEVVEAIKNSIKDKFGKDVEVDLVLQGKYGSSGETETDASKLEKYKQMLDESNNTLIAISQMKSGIDETITEIKDLKLNTNLNEIAQDVSTVKADTSFIKSIISKS